MHTAVGPNARTIARPDRETDTDVIGKLWLCAATITMTA
jgi:hypothetical protein